MRNLTVTLVSLFFIGCASVNTQSGPVFNEWGNKGERQFVKVTFVENNAFAPSAATSVLLECRGLKNQQIFETEDDYERLKNSECRAANAGMHDVGPGVLPGFGSSVVQSAAIVGGAYFIGKGMEGSGNTTETNVEARGGLGLGGNGGDSGNHY